MSVRGTGGFNFDCRRTVLNGRDPWPVVRGVSHRTTVTPGEYPVSLRYALRTVHNSTKTFLELLRMYAASDADKSNGEAQRLVDEIDARLAKPHSQGARSWLDLDAVCHELKISPASAFGWFSEASFTHGANISRMQAAVRAPAITAASIERALDVEEGFDDRKLLFEAMGLIKTGVGRPVQVQQNVFTPPDASTATAVTEQSFEDQQRSAAALLRAPLKQVGAGAVVEGHVRPVHHQPADRPTS